MKFQSILAAALVGAGSASAQTITATTIASSVLPKITSDIASYQSSAAGAIPLSLAQAINSFIATADVDLFSSYSNFGAYASDINAAVTGTPTWLQGAPTQVISFAKSIASAQASIINKDTSGASKIDGALNVAVVGVVAAAAGVAIML